MGTPDHLILLSETEPAEEDRRLLAYASLLGVSVKRLSIRDGSSSLQRLTGELHDGARCLAISATTLASLSNPSVSVAELQQFCHQDSTTLLVFGCTNSPQQRAAISCLTSGAVSGISDLSNEIECFAFPREAVSLSRQLAGLSFFEEPREQISTFELRGAAPSPVEVVMTANERPVFVRIAQGPSQLFLVSTPLPNLEEPLSRDHSLDGHYDRLIPALIFLRHCFGDRCWHGPESTARLIIDDPVLGEKYGFLDCGVLMQSMQRNNYGASIAFIPWNYWRTSQRSAAKLFGGSSNLAICVHGCDHTNKEFETPDETLLGRKAGLALHRMESQHRRIGAAFEPVMVFPQGLFTTAAIAALRSNNYLASVNTTCHPTNLALDELKVSDLLRPAVTRFSGFPLFQRHYPRRVFDFAFDLFLGKPALIAEHHTYFRDNCTALEEFVAALYKQDPDLSWPGLTTQLMRSCRMRSLSDGSVEVQFFTRRFELLNRESGPRHFWLTKDEPDAAAIESVLVDGTSVPFSFVNGSLKLEVPANPGQVLQIEIVDRTQSRPHRGSLGLAHNTAVLLRRSLSEFRDNTLARHSGLLKVARGVARKLKVTGDS